MEVNTPVNNPPNTSTGKCSARYILENPVSAAIRKNKILFLRPGKYKDNSVVIAKMVAVWPEGKLA